MFGRVKMMTALCPAWAHTYQTMCLGLIRNNSLPEAFWLPEMKKNVHVAHLPDYNQDDWN